jgi:hypothetical protein
MSWGREAMEEAMLATPGKKAAVSWSVLQREAEGQMCWAYGGPENGQGTIAPLFFLDPSLSGGGSRFKRARAMLEGAGSMRRLGDVSGDAACAGGRWLAVCKGRFPRVISLMDVCVSNGGEDV